MKLKTIGLSTSIILLISALSGGMIAKADDDEHERRDYKRYERDYKEYEDYDKNENREKFDYYKDDDNDDEYDHDDEYEYDYEEGYEYDINRTTSEQSTWNIWTRSTAVTKGSLPFNNAKTVNFKVANTNNEVTFYVIPRDGEFFVPGKVVAKAFGAEAILYDTSKILEVTSNDTEILFRADRNVGYEKNQKTPLPSISFYMNNDIYIPISVITNALGYSVEWQEESNSFICNPF